MKTLESSELSLTSFKIGLVGWGCLSIAIFFLSFLSPSDIAMMERLFFSIMTTIPIIVFIKNGHFGVNEFKFPSIPAQIYLIWSLALLPSLTSAAPAATGKYFYSSEAKWLGASVLLVWFFVFSLSSGLKKENLNISNKAQKWNSLDLMFLFGTCFVWFIGLLFAIKLNAVSSWSSAIMDQIQGSFDGVMILIYLAFVPLIVFWGCLYIIKNDYDSRKKTGILIIIIGIFGLILYSNRRFILFTALLVLYLLNLFNIKLKFKNYIIGGIGIIVLAGPLLWPIRMAIQNPDLLETQENPLKIAGEAVVKYVTDPEFREMTAMMQQGNQKSGRFNYSDTYLASVQWSIDHGHGWRPSLLFAPITMIPSVVWAEKNEIASELNIKKHFNLIGLSDEPDFPMSPVQEVFFQFGFVGVILGAMFWGKMARFLDNSSIKMFETFEKSLIWGVLYIGFISFEGYFSMFINLAREPFVFALLLMIVRKAIGDFRISEKTLF